MASLYTKSASNQRKSYFLISLFFVVVVLIGYGLSVAYQDPSILFLAVIVSIFSSFYSYWFSHKVVLKMNNAKELKFEDNKELYRIVENLCITAGLPLPKIYIINDPSPNAFATGRDSKHAVIAVTTGLLQKLERSELEGVIAHELSHIGNRDILFATITTVLVGGIIMLADLLRYKMFFGRGGDSNRKTHPAAGLILLAIVIIAPIFAYLMKFAISRQREYLADSDGALLTRYPEGLARALEKISADSNVLKTANKATAHMFIISPLKGKKSVKGLMANAFMTHPPLSERVKRLRQIN